MKTKKAYSKTSAVESVVVVVMCCVETSSPHTAAWGRLQETAMSVSLADQRDQHHDQHLPHPARHHAHQTGLYSVRHSCLQPTGRVLMRVSPRPAAWLCRRLRLSQTTHVRQWPISSTRTHGVTPNVTCLYHLPIFAVWGADSSVLYCTGTSVKLQAVGVLKLKSVRVSLPDVRAVLSSSYRYTKCPLE